MVPVARPVEAAPSDAEVAPQLVPLVEDYDHSVLARAKAHWFFGEWEALAGLDYAQMARQPERSRLALLVAAAQHQIGAADAARKSARLAVQWGCSPRLVAQVLIAGVHNTLGRANALAHKDSEAAGHFRASIAVNEAGSGADALMGHTRAVREMTKLGLLPQATALMDRSLAQAADMTQRPGLADARLKVLQSELELVRGGLALASARGQLFAGAEAEPGSAALAGEATSQLGQDLWVLAQCGHKHGGYFVEFGATDGVLLSNTLLLERRFGWRGICAEPQPGFFSQLQRNRQCIVSDACVAGETGREVEFILADEYGGMSDFALDDSHSDKRQAYQALGKTMRMTTISLQDLLLRHQAPRDIDYLSIDTEGSEYDILRVFPWGEWRIRCITVEHNFSKTREPIRVLLEAHGYRRVEAQWDDWYFLDDSKP